TPRAGGPHARYTARARLRPRPVRRHRPRAGGQFRRRFQHRGSRLRVSRCPMTGPNALRIGATVAVLGALVLGAGRCAPQRPVEKARADVTLVYVGAEDCTPCRAWQATERRRFLGSALASRLTYREVR